ncbi:hypothetical protein [Phenylobacterium sp.]|uniref:hypothetical protein n=1 Tax=Phenylobacterium sp. TaxID=1871053 RepID=UPI0025FDA2C8|nr:hypothetical protein [Phenylobacterium sp.]
MAPGPVTFAPNVLHRAEPESAAEKGAFRRLVAETIMSRLVFQAIPNLSSVGVSSADLRSAAVRGAAGNIVLINLEFARLCLLVFGCLGYVVENRGEMVPDDYLEGLADRLIFHGAARGGALDRWGHLTPQTPLPRPDSERMSQAFWLIPIFLAARNLRVLVDRELPDEGLPPPGWEQEIFESGRAYMAGMHRIMIGDPSAEPPPATLADFLAEAPAHFRQGGANAEGLRALLTLGPRLGCTPGLLLHTAFSLLITQTLIELGEEQALGIDATTRGLRAETRYLRDVAFTNFWKASTTGGRDAFSETWANNYIGSRRVVILSAYLTLKSRVPSAAGATDGRRVAQAWGYGQFDDRLIRDTYNTAGPSEPDL